MDFKKFNELNEATKPKLPEIHTFKDYPSFKKVKELPEGDLYVVLDGDDTFFWYEGDFNISLFPATKNEDFFDNADANHIQVTIDPDYNTSIDEHPYDFNSESGHIKYRTSLSYDSIDLRGSDYTIKVETYERGADEAELEEIKKLKELAKTIKAKDIRVMFSGDIENEIDKIIAEKYEDIAKYEQR